MGPLRTDDTVEPEGEQGIPATRRSVIGPRLYLGFVVLVSAEMFSGSSAGPKLFTWWTWCVTFWVYFLHLFLFANLAVRTRRTSLRALYLWGVVYGIYEGPLTKVIWAGFGSQGEFALAGDGFSGQLLGHGLVEMSMVFLWHPVASFLLPLCVAVVLMPELTVMFPDLARFLAASRRARAVRAYAAATFALTLPAVLSFAYSQTLTLAYVLVTWAVVLGVLALCHRGFGRVMRQPGMGRRVLVLERGGYVLTWILFALMYVLFYFGIFPEALPAAQVQLLTLGLYLLTGLAIWRTPAAERADQSPAADARRLDWGRLRWESASVVIGSIALGSLTLIPSAVHVIQVIFMVNAVIWTLLGPVLFLAAIVPRGLRVPQSVAVGGP